MKATKQEHAEFIERLRANHHKALETLRAPGCRKSGKQLWRELWAIEHRAHNAAISLCNDSNYSTEKMDQAALTARQAIEKIFGHLPKGVKINRDPRGYALKLDCDVVTIPEGMHKDWGGDGIFAAEIN